MPHSGTPRRILAVKLADLGDTVCITPALWALRQGLPEATITLLTTPTGELAVRGLGVLDDLVLFPKHRFDSVPSLLQPANAAAALQLGRRLRRGGYDTVLLFHHLTTSFGTWKYRALIMATGASCSVGLDNGRGSFLTHGVKDDGFGAHHESDYWLSLVAQLGIASAGAALIPPPMEPAPVIAPPERPRVILHPGSGAYAPARRWPVSRWTAVADALVAGGIEVVLVGGPEEADLRRSLLAGMHAREQVVDLGGRTTVGQLVALLQTSTLFLGNDSGVVHLAAAAGAPVIAPYGPTDPRAWGPWSDQPWHTTKRFPNGVVVLTAGPHTTLQSDIPCSPCIYRGHRLGTPQGCPDRTCLERITATQILDVVWARLGSDSLRG